MRTRTFALTAATSAACGAALLGPAAWPATATIPIPIVPIPAPVPDTLPERRVSLVPSVPVGPLVDVPARALAATPPGAPPAIPPETAGAPPETPSDAPVSADELLAEVRSCRQISQGGYRTDASRPKATVPVCAATDAVFWKADMDIDCDGRKTKACNTRTDPYFQPQTAFQTSRGKPLDSAALPFVVVPAPGPAWDYRKSGLTGGSVVAVVHRDRVRYAVIGDTGPAGIIGEGSYALAKELGIDPHPTTGGAASGVTYIAFEDSRISPIESRATAESRGEELARAFVGR
ncbi:glycoside hydrolase family 75 protein [Streptomyces sp. NPDC007346]|uniref:glycoside hydrolase family 75 protein n=1 Tax=Streptomyces sp. NPDC007346 TaxID=3154682 RepID=UPI0034530B43